MKKKNNLTGLMITGAAAVSMGLAGNVQAIPIHGPGSHSPGSHDQNLVSPTAGSVFGSVLAQNAGGHLSSSGPSSPHGGRHGAPTSPPPTTQGPAPITVIPGGSGTIVQVATPAGAVPDGGTTAAMMGGVFGGLVLLKKKLKA